MSITGTNTGDICSRCCCLEDVIMVSELPHSSDVVHSDLRESPSEMERFQAEYFHKACPTCADSPSDSLCASCKHMRLKHLLQCCLLAEPDTSPGSFNLRTKLQLHMGSVRDLRQRSSYCHTCDLFGKMADSVIKRFNASEDYSCLIFMKRESGITRNISTFPTFPNIQCDIAIMMSLELRGHYRDKSGYTLLSTPPPEYLIGTMNPFRGNQLISVRRPNALVDWELVTKWLEDCNGTSGQADSCYMKPEPEFFRELRVVDVKKRRITMAPAPCEYAALSYVWGNASDRLQATTKNIQLLCSEGSLSSAVLPQVIDDAILACEMLKISYIWVDRLCILQDEDPDKKERFLKSMGEIYRNSYLTFVPLAGSDANYGLTGVNKVVRPAWWTGQTQGIYMGSRPQEPLWFLYKSKWISRGWTFQEGELASRLLYFSDKGAFYECSHRKKISLDEVCGPIFGEDKFERDERQAYKRAVWSLTMRDLSLESDILNAFQGILHSRWGNHYYGLPLSIFSDAIFWTVQDEPMIARPTISGVKFPSWSWCSVQNTIQIICVDHSSSEWKKTRSSLATWAIPHVSDGQATLQLVSNASEEPAGFCELQLFKSLFEQRKQELEKANPEPHTAPVSDPLCETPNPMSVELETLKDAYLFPRIAAVLAWKHGCFSASIPPQLNIDGTWEDYENIVSKEWPSLAQFCDEAHCMPQGIMSKKDMEARFPPEVWHKYTSDSIFVYTQSLPVDLTFLDPEESDEISIRIQVDELVPDIVLDSVNIERIENACSQDSPVVFNVIALSVKPFASFRKNGQDDEHIWYDSEGTRLGRRVSELITVELMIVATANGVSQRVGLAEVFLKAWNSQKPQFNTFHLV